MVLWKLESFFMCTQSFYKTILINICVLKNIKIIIISKKIKGWLFDIRIQLFYLLKKGRFVFWKIFDFCYKYVEKNIKFDRWAKEVKMVPSNIGLFLIQEVKYIFVCVLVFLSKIVRK